MDLGLFNGITTAMALMSAPAEAKQVAGRAPTALDSAPIGGGRFLTITEGPGRKFRRAFASPNGLHAADLEPHQRKQRAFISLTGRLYYVSKHFEARCLRRQARIRKSKEKRA